MSATTTIRLSDELKARVAAAAERLGTTAHNLVTHGVEAAAERIQDIIAAIDVLQRNPCIGRPSGGLAGPQRPELCDLVIGRRSRVYVALYAYDSLQDRVLVLAIRGQREAGCTRMRPRSTLS